jgi:putative transcriptional regulator
MRALCALLLLFALPWPASADDAQPLTAILLVSKPSLRDPNFQDSVVLVMNNVGPAPAGIIVNRPTGIPVARLFSDVDGLAGLDDRVYFGGPVQPAMVSFLVRADTAPTDAAKVLDGVYISTNRDLLRKLLARDKPMEGLRIIVGYSGWAPGQLEAEIARGDWTLAPADAATIFDRKSERSWPDPPASAAKAAALDHPGTRRRARVTVDQRAFVSRTNSVEMAPNSAAPASRYSALSHACPTSPAARPRSSTQPTSGCSAPAPRKMPTFTTDVAMPACSGRFTSLATVHVSTKPGISKPISRYHA